MGRAQILHIIGAKICYVAAEPGQNTNRGWIDADWFRVTK